MGEVSVGSAQGTGVRPQDRAGGKSVSVLQLVRGVHDLCFAVVLAEDAEVVLGPRGPEATVTTSERHRRRSQAQTLGR